MKLYTSQAKYNVRTGKFIENIFVESEDILCDYTGEKIASDDIEKRPLYEIVVEQIGGAEESYYYDDEKLWFEEQNINYHSLWTNPFHFIATDSYDGSIDFIKEWHDNVSVHGGIFKDTRTLDEALRKCRVRTIKKLLQSNMYTPGELGLEQTNE